MEPMIDEPVRTVVIVGGVAGGGSTAARLRRQSETDRIIVLEQGPYISYANCGIPYFVSGVIEKESSLFLATPKLFKDRFNVEVRTESKAVAVDAQRQTVTVEDVQKGQTYELAYDELVLSPGADCSRPPLPGLDLAGVFCCKTVPDGVAIKNWVAERAAKSAVVVGAGFIGLEVAENLKHLGLQVSVVEMLDQVMPPWDKDMAIYIEQHLKANGINMVLHEAIKSIEKVADSDKLCVKTARQTSLTTDLVVLAIGVRPRTELAVSAGCELGKHRGIKVDQYMRTTVPHVHAVGDAIETVNVGSGLVAPCPLAGPANRQGRLVADNLAGRERAFRGVQGTSVLGVFGLTAAMTGLSEKALQYEGAPKYEVVHHHPQNHVGYYPGGSVMHFKLVFNPEDGRILGTQIVGSGADVERRVDVVAMAIQMRGTVFDLEECELCYAPQFGAAKDAVNLAGFIAANHVRGDTLLAQWRDVPRAMAKGEVFLVDCRTIGEFARGHYRGAVNIPVDDFRARIAEFPKDKPTWVYCGVGKRAHFACRILAHFGIANKNVTGGWSTCSMQATINTDLSECIDERCIGVCCACGSGEIGTV